jgi:hypothetical protein
MIIEPGEVNASDAVSDATILEIADDFEVETQVLVVLASDDDLLDSMCWTVLRSGYPLPWPPEIGDVLRVTAPRLLTAVRKKGGGK